MTEPITQGAGLALASPGGVARVAAPDAFPDRSLSDLRLRARMIWAAWRHRHALAQMQAAPPGGALDRFLTERPRALGALLWPYQVAPWGPAERLHRIAGHYAELDRFGAPFAFGVDEQLVLADLGDIYPGLRLVLDQPKWFLREGGLVVNIFIDDFRAFSVAFSLFRNDQLLEAVIGCVQGRNRDDALDLYRDLTKALHGIRPRDFTLEAARMIMALMGVERLLAVADQARHHRHSYFGARGDFPHNYDDVWADRGGQRLSPDLFELPLKQERRPLDEIKAKKRSLYRKRYAFLDELETNLADGFTALTPVPFKDT